MGEPRAITYKQVKTATGNEGSLDVWDQIGRISGAGQVPTGIDDDGSIDLTDVSDSKRQRIDDLLANRKEEKEEAVAEDATKKKTK